MDIVIIGSGNVATVLGISLQSAGHRILQVFSRKEENAIALAHELGCEWTTETGKLNRQAELYLFALSDEGLRGLTRQLSFPGKLVAHTAGAVPLEILKPVSERCAVLYPLQSIRREIRPFPAIPFLIDAKESADLETIRQIAASISTLVSRAGDATRLKLHLSAIFVNNFTNHLFTLAQEYCSKEELDFSLLLPLIRETADRLAAFPPQKVQTGPAIRGDASTMQRHLQLLAGHSGMTGLYLHLSRLIWEHYQQPENPFPL